jgi:hypothetical protein
VGATSAAVGAPAGPLAVQTAQVVFGVALGIVALLIVVFAGYVISTTVWGDRWARRSR